MSDINGRRVLHVVSELKITRTYMNFEKKTVFQKRFYKEVPSKVRFKKSIFMRKAYFRKHNPKIHIYFPQFCYIEPFIFRFSMSEASKIPEGAHVRGWFRQYLEARAAAAVPTNDPPPPRFDNFAKYVRTLKKWVENLFTGQRHLLKLETG